MENRALGKGLSALIPDNEILSRTTEEAESLLYVETAKIRENTMQPRTQYREEELSDLADSIKEKGILQPILLRETIDGYEVIAGERRLRAARAINLEKVPAVIKKASNRESLELALVENIQREELNAIEEARAFRRLIEEFHMTQETVAAAVGKNRSTISNIMRLLNLPEAIQKSVSEGSLSMGHARALLSVEDPRQQTQIFEKVLQQGLSVRDLENLIKRELEKTSRRAKIKNKQKDNDIAALEEELRKIIGTKVQIQARQKRGKIIIEYYSLDDLDRILNIIKRA